MSGAPDQDRADQDRADDLFWDLAAPLLARDDTEEGRIMSSRCLRVNGDFCAMVARSGQLVVKLPAPRVQELIDAGVGEPFAPAGRVFKEWLAVSVLDDARWDALLRESHDFIRMG